MRISAVAFFMILTTVFLSGCGKQDMASLDDRGNNYYSRNGILSLASGLNQNMAPAAGANTISANNIGVNGRTWANPFGPPSAPLESTVASNGWQWPVNGRVIETYGLKSDGVTNEGIVIAASEGTPIRAAQPGKVAFVGEDNKNYGNIVILRHADGTMTSYSHARNIVVHKDEQVGNGGIIAYVGKTGNAKEPELHFAVREGRAAVDPMTKLPHQLASN